VRSERQSRSIIYRADLDAQRGLMLFLIKDCCAGDADLCAPLLAELTPWLKGHLVTVQNWLKANSQC
jgi:ArsR family transcriptional regulator